MPKLQTIGRKDERLLKGRAQAQLQLKGVAVLKLLVAKKDDQAQEDDRQVLDPFKDLLPASRS